MNTNLSISFIKENCQTIGELKRRADENREQSVEKEGNKLNTRNGYSENISPFNPSLLPQTFNFTKVKQIKDNLLKDQAFKELGLVML